MIGTRVMIDKKPGVNLFIRKPISSSWQGCARLKWEPLAGTALPTADGSHAVNSAMRARSSQIFAACADARVG